MPEYHSLPDLKPYDYYRSVGGNRLCFPRREVKRVVIEESGIFLEATSGCRFKVVASKPELNPNMGGLYR